MIIDSVKKHWSKAVLGALIPMVGCSSIYSVDPSDVAHIRRMGTVVTQPANPIGSGPHLKIPFIDTVDRLQVSISKMTMDTFPVNTIDNQEIKLDINLTYRVPPKSAYHLLYGVGSTGNIDIDSTIKPIIMDRAAQIFSVTNTNSISANRSKIQFEVTDQVRKLLHDQFKIDLLSLQISKIGYSNVFRTSNDNAVSSKNNAIAEQNNIQVERAKAEKGIVRAQGIADAARIEGQGEGQRLHEVLQAVGGADNYAKIKAAEAMAKWNGQTPQVIASGNNGSAAPFMLQVPKP